MLHVFLDSMLPAGKVFLYEVPVVLVVAVFASLEVAFPIGKRARLDGHFALPRDVPAIGALKNLCPGPTFSATGLRRFTNNAIHGETP